MAMWILANSVMLVELTDLVQQPVAVVVRPMSVLGELRSVILTTTTVFLAQVSSGLTRELSGHGNVRVLDIPLQFARNSR